MDHRQAWELLSPYRDGELNNADQKAVAAHVAHCGECRSELAAWNSMGAAIFRRPMAAPSTHFSSRVMARLADPPIPVFDPVWLSLRRPAPLRSGDGERNWDAVLRRWLIPAFGAALAAAALALLVPEQDSTGATELLLLADAQEDSGTLGPLLASEIETDSYDEQLLEEP
ncbi:MAG: zf-HC2 domain-containing protein [Nitrospirae bacterium]|nr:zf-HC2 domain-containing protein [Nitrospirota bacterium]